MTTNNDFDPAAEVNRATARAASTAKGGIDAAGAGADRALNAAASKLNEARDHAAPALKRGIEQAKGWVDDRASRLQDGVRTTRNKANEVTDQVIDYTRDEPVKALLIAAAVGAGLLGLFSLIARSDD